jgi:hypothetical protein
MDVRYQTVTDWEYKEFVGEAGFDLPRLLDFRRNDGSFKYQGTVVLLEFGHDIDRPGKYKTGYTGRMVAKRVKQTMCNRLGVLKGWIALLYEAVELTDEMRETAEKIIASYNPADGKIPT